ncbi:hypothetical protein BaRGS_00003320 [Batillaria attramentaria]|uniref:Dynein regulatory complex subunit 7 n=1 Tax=Batillaria attramentaria TaxID=370345 RepID=A0ABD0M203_9CAEN
MEGETAVEDSNKIPDSEVKEDPTDAPEGDANPEKADEEKPEGDEGKAAEGEPAADQIEELTEDAEALKQELEKIVVVTPPQPPRPEEKFDPADFPPSYKDNLPKELLVLQYVDNFRRQYVHLYRDRKPLFLNPVNEFGVEKFVCTTIRPTQLHFKELYNWDGAAEFVADYLDFDTLDPPYEIPTRMLSPATVLKRQRGNCFEYSTLLCSLLIAAGYDAYVVNGYATRETCIGDETREICPLLKKKEEIRPEETKREMKKYSVKPPKDLRSKFILKMEARKREVPESFFIEPFTGISHSVMSPNYLGIESVWNNFNYWSNMQDCSEGVGKISYDLGDCTCWEYMFPGLDKPILQIPEADDDLLDDDDEDKDADVEKHLDMPPSWVEPLRLIQRDFEMRCPQGKKLKLYKRAKLEKFAHYLMKDGLVCRLSVYDNRELTDLVMVKEYYQHREDKLYQRIHNHRSGWITESFFAGRAHCLKEHQYKASAPGPENERTMLFFHEARVDGLEKRVETATEMTEHFIDRDDFLYYKHVIFGKRPKKFGPQESSAPNANPRPIVKMVIKFRRNPAKIANDDVAEMVFLCAEDKIQLTYHTEHSNIAASTRDYIKPPNWDEKGAILNWAADMHQTFQVDPHAEPSKQVKLYEFLVYLLKEEEKCRERVRESEDEVREILNEREKEEAASDLEISVYDTERNEKARTHRRELEQRLLEEKLRKQEMEIDYLAPFLAQMGDPEKISRAQAYKLKEDCLADLKQRLIDKANLIQARFEKETHELQKKQAWYQQNQVSMSKDDEEDYLNYCSEAMFRIHILELRLNRHKEIAPHKYMALEQRLRNDPRLAEYF